MPPFFNRMSYTLIITEKPNASKKIAEALADKKPKKEVYQKKVPYYTLEHDGKKIVIASAVGHIFGLDEKEKSKGFKYPVFDIEWKPSYEISKGADFTKKYAMALKKLTKDADEFIIATDYDVEGEVIGLNVLRYICKQKDAKRMKFSTLTKGDLQKSYDNALPTIDWGQALAGETRHKLDWFYGINWNSQAINVFGQLINHYEWKWKDWKFGSSVRSHVRLHNCRTTGGLCVGFCYIISILVVLIGPNLLCESVEKSHYIYV